MMTFHGNPWGLMREGKSVADIIRRQKELEAEGRSLWDFPSWAYIVAGIIYTHPSEVYIAPQMFKQPQKQKKQEQAEAWQFTELRHVAALKRKCGIINPVDVNECLRRISLPQRRVLARYIKDDASIVRIAGDIGKEPEDVKVYLHRAKMHLCIYQFNISDWQWATDIGLSTNPEELLLNYATPKQTVYLILRYYLDYSFNDIAHRLGVSPTTVQNYLARSLKELQARAAKV